MIIYLVSGITFQVSLAARNGSTRRESCAEIDSIIDDEEDDDGTLCCHGWHLDIDLFICVRMYMYIYIYMSNRKNPGNTKYVFDGHWLMEIDGNC